MMGAKLDSDRWTFIDGNLFIAIREISVNLLLTQQSSKLSCIVRLIFIELRNVPGS